ncbi:glutathione S-transferase family protein [Camelimonas abortus]|uniref:Glutathione S-transferase family protein n=1 Tax=Camelimonas abortus TaxID=1017184 RepID=A0ABV7LFW5_9HYPH
MKLIVASKRYSSWSLRPWLALRVAGVPFDEEVVLLRQPDTKAQILRRSPSGFLPALQDGDLTVWDSLAIIEHVAGRFPEAGLWPEDGKARAFARSIAAEMHAGFQPLRMACPMNVGVRFAARDRGPAVAAAVARITDIWREARARYGEGGPFLFGRFTAADAMYAPVALRVDGYSIAVDPVSRAWIDAVLALPAMQEWRAAGLKEPAVADYDDLADETPVERFRPA